MRQQGRQQTQAEYYRGVRMAPYDLVKEALVALAVVLVLVIVLAALFSSPDDPPMTIRQVAQQTPDTFLQVAIADLDGTGDIASYGPPYNDGTDSVQYLGPVSLQQIGGITIPVDTAQDFVIQPLQQMATTDPSVASALKTFQSATPDQQAAWEKAYEDAASKATANGPNVTVPAGDYGPVGPMMAGLLKMGQDGGLDGYLLTSTQFYQTDYTKPLLFIQGDPLHNAAEPLNLLGSQWGMMNETGSYPGQAWLWLYTFWYQVPPWSTSSNGDALVWLTMAILTLILVLVPFIPGLNQLPRYLGVYKLIWRDWYREQGSPAEGGQRAEGDRAA